MKMLEKILNKLGYYKASQLIQPPPKIKQDRYKPSALRSSREFTSSDMVELPENLIRRITTEGIAEMLPDICEFTQEESGKGTYIINAKLRYLEMESEE